MLKAPHPGGGGHKKLYTKEAQKGLPALHVFVSKLHDINNTWFIKHTEKKKSFVPYKHLLITQIFSLFPHPDHKHNTIALLSQNKTEKTLNIGK